MPKPEREREREGGLIEKDLSERLSASGELEAIEERWPEAIKSHQETLRKKIAEISGTAGRRGEAAPGDGILHGKARYSGRDSAAEGARGPFHGRRSASKEEIGRKLDFVIQEMVRETNTIASKSNDLSISERAILIKVEIEKMREQVQNVE